MKDNTPLVSVIIPFFKDRLYLREAIESVINQEYENWEILLIDDRSSDGSTEFALEYCNKKEYNIFYYTHVNRINKGVAASRNLGISKSNGMYIAFLDADDKWKKEKLKTQLEILTDNPEASMLCEASDYWYSWNDENKNDIKKEIGVPGEQLYDPPYLALNLYPLKSGKKSPGPSGIIIKKEACNNNICFEESFIGVNAPFEDQAFLFKVYLREKIYVSSISNTFYRQRDDSAMHITRVDNNEYFIRYFYFKWARNYLRRQGIQHDEIERLISMMLKPYKLITLKKMWRTIKQKFN